MTYVAAVIASNPQNYWRLNEGPGATAALDYGNQPGMLWLGYYADAGSARRGVSGAGFGGITADGGSWNSSAGELWNRTAGASGVNNPYVPFPDPGTLEFWTFGEQISAATYVGWFAPNVVTPNNPLFGLTAWDNHLDVNVLTSVITQVPLPQGQWSHVALVWSAGTGFVYVNGTQAANVVPPTPLGGGRVHFFIGDTQSNPPGLNVSGLVTEVATYRRALTVGDLDVHFNQAELKGQRPHWIGPRQASASGSVTIDRAYSVGVTHVARTGSSSFSVPTGLRGFMIDIIDPKPPGRVLVGTPPYLWDVGWVSILDANGMLAERRPNRDRTIWLPDGAELATVFTHDLLPGWTIDVSELDPA